MKMDKEKIIKAGKIAGEVKKYARTIIKKGVPLIEIADKIDNKIKELGAKTGFPVNLSINEVAAHYTPTADDKTLAHGLLKVDVGISIDGWIADTAFSLDLEDNEENKKLIQASQEAVDNAIKIVKSGVTTGEIGKVVQETIESHGFTPVVNLSGHEIKQFEIHAGLTIPNINNKSKDKLSSNSLYAIEPFATSGQGKIYNGADSNIYQIVEDKNTRSSTAREILKFIKQEYYTLPFCSRWIVRKFGAKARFGLHELEKQGIIHHFKQLVEFSGKNVSQAEHTILIDKKGEVIITSLEN